MNNTIEVRNLRKEYQDFILKDILWPEPPAGEVFRPRGIFKHSFRGEDIHPLRSYNFFVRQDENTLLLAGSPQTRRLG